MKNLMFTIVALLFSLTMSANSIEGTPNLPTNDLNNHKIEVVEEAIDCLVGVIESYSLYIEIGEDYIY